MASRSRSPRGSSPNALPGSAFGDDPEALRLRLATGLLYGESEEQREAALAADNPLRLPWIAAALARVEEILADLSPGRAARPAASPLASPPAAPPAAQAAAAQAAAARHPLAQHALATAKH